MPFVKRLTTTLILAAFLISTISSPCRATDIVSQLPSPGALLPQGETFTPVLLKGLKVYPQDPLRFDFILDPGSTSLITNDDVALLARYFLTALTVPEDDLWVNLSPYEKDRIIPNEFSRTEMGRNLLAQDYILKQRTSSLMNPEGSLGKILWKRIYALAYEKYGTTDLPFDTFNKIWIIPDEATIDVSQNTAFITQSRLKVMLDTDYLALRNHAHSPDLLGTDQETSAISQQVIRDVLLPQLEQEINTSKNFSELRQIYHAMILSTWFKRHMQKSLVGRMYNEQNKVTGIDLAEKTSKEDIWQQYVTAFKIGAFNYIKEEIDPTNQEAIPRHYFSGGFDYDASAVTEKPASQIPMIFDTQRWLTAIVRLDPERPSTITPKAFVPPLETTRDQRDILQQRTWLEKRRERLSGLKTKLQTGTLPETLMFGDLHGRADDLERIVKKAENFIEANRKTGKKLKIIGHGDYFDRGTENTRVFDLMKKLKELERSDPETLEVIFLAGNHDLLFLKAVITSDHRDFLKWISPRSGGIRTLKSFNKRKINEVIQFMLTNFDLIHINDDWVTTHTHGAPLTDQNGRPLITRARLNELQTEWNNIRIRTIASQGSFLNIPDNIQQLNKLLYNPDIEWILRGRLNDGVSHLTINSETSAEPNPKDLWTIDRQKMMLFLAEQDTLGVVFGHIHHPFFDAGLLGIDSYDTPQGGHFGLNAERGLESYLVTGETKVLESKEAMLTRLDGEIGAVNTAIQTINDQVGGIDLDPRQLKLRETGEGSPGDTELETGIESPLTNQPIEGFRPIVISLSPTTNPGAFFDQSK